MMLLHIQLNQKRQLNYFQKKTTKLDNGLAELIKIIKT